jgi:hypothetical protein
MLLNILDMMGSNNLRKEEKVSKKLSKKRAQA